MPASTVGAEGVSRRSLAARIGTARIHQDLRDTPYCQRVASLIKTVTFDAADALALARFWAAALGSDVDEDSTPDKAFVEAAGWGGPNMWFVRVSEPKTAKNRMHFDLRAPGPAEEEVARLVALGATVLARLPANVVMRDPEGNEFCVEELNSTD